MKKNPTAETKTGIFPPCLRHQPIHAVGSRNRRRSRDGRIMKTSQAELMATPQFDSGRWKLRLERVPFSAGKQTTVGTIPIISVSSLSVVHWALRLLKKIRSDF